MTRSHRNRSLSPRHSRPMTSGSASDVRVSEARELGSKPQRSSLVRISAWFISRVPRIGSRAVANVPEKRFWLDILVALGNQPTGPTTMSCSSPSFESTPSLQRPTKTAVELPPQHKQANTWLDTPWHCKAEYSASESGVQHYVPAEGQWSARHVAQRKCCSARSIFLPLISNRTPGGPLTKRKQFCM